MSMIISKWVFGLENLVDVLQIRKSVFHDEQDHEDIMDKEDKTALHVLVGEDDVYYAAGRIYDDNGEFKINMICVEKQLRGKNLDSLIVRLLIYRGFELLAKKIFADAGFETVGFYEKLNFEICGAEYIDNHGKKIIPMVLKKENSPLDKGCSGSGCCECSQCNNCGGCQSKSFL